MCDASVSASVICFGVASGSETDSESYPNPSQMTKGSAILHDGRANDLAGSEVFVDVVSGFEICLEIVVDHSCVDECLDTLECLGRPLRRKLELVAPGRDELSVQVVRQFVADVVHRVLAREPMDTLAAAALRPVVHMAMVVQGRHLAMGHMVDHC